MTIDEAIENEKSRAENCKGHYDRFVQMEAKEHEQIAEWLEELKVYQQHEIICNKGYNAGYRKAIDDFVEKVKLKYIGVHPDELYEKYYPMEICEQIKELSEQLKAGGENDKSI